MAEAGGGRQKHPADVLDEVPVAFVISTARKAGGDLAARIVAACTAPACGLQAPA
ncbi:hypothetical protein ACTMU2_25645 [Cupriavidus basilensis]